MEYETKQILVEDIEDINSSNLDKSTHNQFVFKYYLNIFKRRWLMILGFFISGLIPAYFWSRLDPVYYRGNFEMLLEPVTSEEQLTDPSVIAGLGSNNNNPEDIFGVDYPTIIKVLNGRTILQRVATKISQENPKYTTSYLLETFRENLSVVRAKSGESRFDTSKIIGVTYSSIEPQLTVAVLNTLVDEYLKYSLEEREKNLQSGVTFIEEQLPIIKSEINQLQEKQETIQRKYEFIQPQVKGENLSSINVNNKQELQKLDTQIRELTVLASKLQQDLGLTAEEAIVAMTLSQDPERTTLLNQLQQIESQMALDSAVLNPTHPTLLNLKEQKENLDKLLAQENRRILRENNISLNVNSRVFAYQDSSRLALIQQLVETQNQLETLFTRYQSLNLNQSQTTDELKILPNVIKEYENIQRQIELNTNILNQLSSQKEALTVDLIKKQTPWEVLSQPQLILDEYGRVVGDSPNYMKKLLAGSAAGLTLGLLVAFLIDKSKDVVYEASDLKYAFGLPILGTLPLYDNNSGNSLQEKADFFSDKDNSIDKSSESYNRLTPTELSTSKSCLSDIYANLHFRLANSGNPNHNEVLISSLNPADGQGYLCANLAKIAADIDRKVLLIDANNFEEEIAYYLDDSLYNKPNLPENSTASESEIEQNALPQPNISVLTAGRENADYPLSLGSEQTQAGIKSIAKNYDMILYNTSFFLEIYDVSLLAEQTQGIVMVVRLKQTSLSVLNEAVKKIKNYDLNFLGFVVIE